MKALMSLALHDTLMGFCFCGCLGMGGAKVGKPILSLAETVDASGLRA